MSALGHAIRFVGAFDRAAALPADEGREVAFAGRSNAGKSSALNAITGRRGLARVSRSPGRTQQLVCFEVGEQRRIVDLPGYGFAKVPEAVRRRWRPMIETYLGTRASLAGLVVVMDARRPFTDLDRQMLDWAAAAGLAVLVLLSKADKLGAAARARALADARDRAGRWGGHLAVMLFSATSRLGVDDARARIEAWLEPEPAEDGPDGA